MINLLEIAIVATCGLFLLLDLVRWVVVVALTLRRRREQSSLYQTDRKSRAGAAYRALFPLVCPNDAVDPTAKDEIDRRLLVFEAWAGAQDPVTRRAYLDAVREMRGIAATFYINNMRSRHMGALMQLMPVPPVELIVPKIVGNQNDKLEADGHQAVSEQPRPNGASAGDQRLD